MTRDIRDSFPSKYIKASDLKGREINLTIDRVEYEAVGQAKEVKPVVYFRTQSKGVVLNKTNCNTLIALTQTPDPEEWRGVRVTLYPAETTYQGEQIDCIRIRKDSPAKRKAIRPPDDETPIRKRGASAPAPMPDPEPEPEPDEPDEPEPADAVDDDIPF